LAAITAFQALSKYDGNLEGKTVFVPAGRTCEVFTTPVYTFGRSNANTDNSTNVTVSGTGASACQLAKNVFHAGKVITTVSTAKVPRVAELLGEGVVDQS